MWANYILTHVVEMRPYELGEDLTHIHVNSVDNPRTDLGMIARNIDRPGDMWYISKARFKGEFKLKED